MKYNYGHRIVAPLLLAVVGVCLCCSDDDEIVDPNNSAPVIDSVTAVPDTFLNGEVFTVTSYATDPEGDALQYEWSYGGLDFQPVPGGGGNKVLLKNCCDITDTSLATIYSEVSDGGGGSDIDSVIVCVIP